MSARQLITTAIALLGVVLFFVLQSYISLPQWLEWLGPFTLAASVSFALVLPLSWIAAKTGLVDRPNERKIHEGAIPLVGGIAIYAGFLAVNFHYGYHLESEEIRAVMIALGPLLLIGVLDDLWDLPATLKLLVQLGAAAIVISAGVRITFLPPALWGNVAEIVLTALWLIGLTNAINFLDGIDGLATSMTIVTAGSFGLVAVATGQPFFLLLCAALCGACAGFLPHNFRRRPASVFLGDSGATLLGFSLAAIAIIGDWGGNGSSAVNVVVPLLILGVPIFDTTFITITRFADGRIRTFREWLEYAGRDHIHHRLLKIGLSRFDAVFFLCVTSLILALSAITLKDATGLFAVLSFIQGVIILTVIGRFMLFMDSRSEAVREDSNGSVE
ncbi:MraY family glycosyltransferase [Candidatus Zixiibacteriota bacterium]